jgi:hypothetical protein
MLVTNGTFVKKIAMSGGQGRALLGAIPFAGFWLEGNFPPIDSCTE